MAASISMFRTLDLPGGSLVPFVSVPGERVRILYGRVWLTEEGRTHDAFLASGEEARLDSRGLVVIEALGPARVQLYEEARRPASWSRLIAAQCHRAIAWGRWRLQRGFSPTRGAA